MPYKVVTPDRQRGHKTSLPGDRGLILEPVAHEVVGG
jgi:hypothetical protein